MSTVELLLFLWLSVGCVGSKPTEKKERVHHEAPLSDRAHDDAQSFDYDHDAFLGADEAKTFDQLTPEESKERLGTGITTPACDCGQDSSLPFLGKGVPQRKHASTLEAEDFFPFMQTGRFGYSEVYLWLGLC